jgi:putative effector of murein hydrolase
LTPLRDIEVIGDMILARLPFASAIARGALFGVGANGARTALPLLALL